MTTSLILTIINALFFVLFLSIYVIKKKFDLGALILTIYTIANITSIYFYWFTNESQYSVFYEENYDFSNVSLIPMLYFNIALLICIYPILTLKDRKIKIESKPNFKLLYGLSVIISILAIDPVLENLIQCFKTGQGTSSNSLGAIYDNDINIDNNLSWIGRKLNYILKIFEMVTPILFFYLLSQYKVTKKRISIIVIIGLGIAMLNPLLNGYATASRVMIVKYFLYIGVCYMLCKPALNANLIKRINKVGLIFCSCFIVLTFLITLARFQYNTSNKTEENSTVWSWISLYSGEGILRFNTQMWHTKVHTKGDNSFSLPKTILGLKTFKSNDQRRKYWESKMKIQTNVFFTFIGDFYSDLGKVGTIFFCLILSLILKKLITPHYNTISIEALILTAIIVQIYIFGFTFYVYKTYDSQIMILYPIIISILLHIKRKMNLQ